MTIMSHSAVWLGQIDLDKISSSGLVCKRRLLSAWPDCTDCSKPLQCCCVERATNSTNYRPRILDSEIGQDSLSLWSCSKKRLFSRVLALSVDIVCWSKFCQAVAVWQWFQMHWITSHFNLATATRKDRIELKLISIKISLSRNYWPDTTVSESLKSDWQSDMLTASRPVAPT